MKYLTLESYTDFKCTGSKCPCTCCGGWQIVIDEETDRFYQNVDSELGERLRNNICRDGREAKIILDEEGLCPFLNETGLCSIQLGLGEEHLSNTCRYYPRYNLFVGDICFAGVSISCPEVSRFYLTHEDPLLIDYAENDDNGYDQHNTDWELFNRAIRTFTTAVAIAQNRDRSVKERIALVILLAGGFQACIDEGRDASEIIGLYSNPEYYNLILDQTGIKTCDLSSKTAFTGGLMSLFGTMRTLDKKLPEISELITFFSDPDHSTVDPPVWEKAFALSSSGDYEIWRENLLVYILFKYFMQGLSEKNFHEKLMSGIGPVLITSTCITALYYIMHGKEPDMDYIIMLVMRLSRLIEHNQEIGREVCNYFMKAGYMDPGYAIRLIS
ncbi:MAG: flagellin lysine-N-methylase [Lachnospiraceae bacterium]|nr:flagellin lysine-N-methylase [Lachnospiraceae bacterium]